MSKYLTTFKSTKDPTEDELKTAIETAANALYADHRLKLTARLHLPWVDEEPDSYCARLFDRSGDSYRSGHDYFLVEGHGTRLRAWHHLAEAVALTLDRERARIVAAHDVFTGVLTPLRAALEASGDTLKSARQGCDEHDCVSAATHVCNCPRCQRETSDERYYACSAHRGEVGETHDRVRGRMVVWAPL